MGVFEGWEYVERIVGGGGGSEVGRRVGGEKVINGGGEDGGLCYEWLGVLFFSFIGRTQLYPASCWRPPCWETIMNDGGHILNLRPAYALPLSLYENIAC